MNNKLRKVLEKCIELGKNIDESLGNNEFTVWNCRYERSAANSIVEIAKSALAEPLRNCDIGTAEEQAKRFEEFCLKHIGCAEETGGRHCVGCPLEKASRNITQKCELYWSQMPYDEVK